MPPIEIASETDDLRASLTEQFAAADSAVSEPAAEPVADPAPVTEVADAEIPDRPVETRERNADGTFKPKTEPKTEAAPTEAAPVKTDPPATDKPAAASVEPSKADAPPVSWPADAKAHWTALPPALKAAVLKRETEISEGGRQWSEQRRRYEQMLGPVAQEAQANGLGLEQGLTALVNAQRALTRDPVSALKQLAQQYGVDLATLSGQPAAEGSREAIQPDISALVQRAVAPHLAPIQSWLQTEQTRKSEESIAFVTDFANKDEHKHFATVENEIMALIPVIQASNPHWDRGKILQDAYDRSVHANPTTRVALQAEAETAAEAKRRAEASARANKARTAASSVTGAPNGAAMVNAPKDSLRAEIEAAYAGG